MIYSELHDRFEKREKYILYEREKDVFLGLLNQNCIIVKSEDKELERQLREAKKTIRVSFIMVIVLSFCLVGFSVWYFMRVQRTCRNQEKMVKSRIYFA